MSRPIRLVRQVSFSSGHRYWLAELSETENRALFGRWASPYNHGHNYVLEASFEGSVDPATGMVVNIKDLDELMRDRVVSAYDQKSVNDEVDGFLDRSPTLENIAADIAGRLQRSPETVRLAHIRLFETPELWVDLDLSEGDSRMTLTRTYEFAASHRLHVPALTPEQNLELFGKCNNPAGHGHNYVVEVTVAGEPDPRTGMLADLEALDAVVHERVVERYDHRHFNEDLPEFAGKVPTSEVILQAIWAALEGNLPARLVRIRLHETARSSFEMSA